MENRNGLCVALSVADANPATERTEAIRLLKRLRRRGFRPTTVGGDKAYDTQQFVEDVRALGIAPHVAQNITRHRGSKIDARTTRYAGYAVSQRCRKRIEEIFGWAKTIGGLRKTRYRGRERTRLWAYFVGSAYNLLRMAKLLPEVAVPHDAVAAPSPFARGRRKRSRATTRSIRRPRRPLSHPRRRPRSMTPIAITDSSATC